MERFLRTERLLGSERMAVLRRKKVTVIGLGAVGSYAAEGLARSGISRFRLVDFDHVQITNINRQLYALESTLGQPKVELAAGRIRDINPAAEVEKLPCFFHADTAAAILDNAPDLVIDAIDGLSPKVCLLATLYRRGIPVISSMGAALKTDPFKIRAADIFDTEMCPLARRIRRRLSKQGIGRGLLCVYSMEKVDYTFTEEDQTRENGVYTRGRIRRLLGSLPTITGIFGLTIANLAVRLLSGEELSL